jgi:hypothetical protein
MRLEPDEQGSSLGQAPLSPLLLREARERAHAWLARFAPLLDDSGELSADDCRSRLETITELRDEGPAVLLALQSQAGTEEAELVGTLQQAVAEVEARETELRQRLGRLAPGDPQAAVDLERLRERLAEAAARREVESVVGRATGDEVLSLQSSPGSKGAAAMSMVFGLGMFAFTCVHAVLFIGGFMRVIGLFALAFLLFYAIFWSAAAALIWSGVRAACRETIELRGRELTVLRSLAGREWRQKYTLACDARACLTQSSTSQQNQPSKEVQLRAEDGTDIRLAFGRPPEEQERLVERINMHLAALPR